MRRALLVAALAAGACGADDAKVCAAAGDAGVAAELGTVDTSDSNVLLSPMRKNLFLEIFIDPDSEVPDLLELELYAGAGVFTGGDVRPGTFRLDGAETRYDQCGACLLLLVDRAPATLRPAAYYMPLSGTLRLDAVSGRIAGALEDVTLRHVRIDLDDPDGPGGPLQPSLATTTIDDGCTVHLTRAAFDVAIEEPETADAGP